MSDADEKSLFAAPPMGEQERMVEAILFASADPVTVADLQSRMPHGCDPAEALVHLRKRYEGRGVALTRVGDAWAFRTAPDLGFLMTTALIASDWYIVPVFPSGYDLKGLETLWKTVEKVRSRFNPHLKLLGVLLGNFDSRPKLDNDIQKMLAQKFGKDLFATVIHRSVKHREANVYGQTIFEHASGQQPAEQFQALAREVLARLEKSLKEEKPEEPVLLEVNRGR